jgi:transcriptional regulator with XRE-family HTH domain
MGEATFAFFSCKLEHISYWKNTAGGAALRGLVMASTDLHANQIGARLKEIRRTLDRTLAEVSQTTGVSISNLSKIENNQISPSFDIMKRICDGLGVSIEDFVRPGAKNVVSGRKTTTRRGEGDYFTSGQYEYRAHASELSRKGMVPLEIVVHARSVDEFDHWSQHRGEEFVYVLSGAIEVHTEHYAPFRLERGESAYFDSSMRHLYVTVSKDDAKVLSVSHDPGSPEDISQFMNSSARQVERPDD